jgi:hypothetical protein
MKLTKPQIIVLIIFFVMSVVTFALTIDKRNKTRLKETTEEIKGVEYDSTSTSKIREFDTDGDGHLDEYEMDNYSSYVMDSMMTQAREELNVKKAENSKKSGVDIVNVKITHDEYSTKWDNVRVTFKNNTGKTIKAIRFMWYDVKNAFGEELNPTYDGGDFTDIVKDGKQTHGTWETYEDQMESVKVYVSKIVFTDGTEWNND